MGNRAVVESFAAKILTVYKPTSPSPAQAEKGIHKQGLVVGLGDDTLSVTLNEAGLHMDDSFQGKMMNFTCTTNDSGQAVGMVINRWKKGEEEKIGVDVWATAEMFAIDGSAPAAHDQTEQKPPQDTEPEKPIDYLQGARNYAAAHFAVYEIFKDAGYEGEINNEAIAEKSTHYLIGADNVKVKGLCKQVAKANEPAPDTEDVKTEDNPVGTEKVAVTPASKSVDPPADPEPEASPDNNQKQVDEPANTDSTPDPSDEPTPWNEVTDSEGAVISAMPRHNLIDLCIKLIPFSESEHPVIKPGYTAMENSRQTMELSYADIYDVYEVGLNQDHELHAISEAYKLLDTQYQGLTEDVCEAILSDQVTFLQMVENHEPQTTPA